MGIARGSCHQLIVIRTTFPDFPLSGVVNAYGLCFPKGECPYDSEASFLRHWEPIEYGAPAKPVDHIVTKPSWGYICFTLILGVTLYSFGKNHLLNGAMFWGYFDLFLALFFGLRALLLIKIRSDIEEETKP